VTERELALRREIFAAFAHTGAPPDVQDRATLRALAARWYGDRLDPDWRPRSAAESQRILDEVGLTGEFWRLVQ
jgi:hypothetical protein